MPELLLKSGRRWLRKAVVSWMSFNPVGRDRKSIHLQIVWYADHPATLILTWKMQDKCSLLYKKCIWKGKKMLWVLTAFFKHCCTGVEETLDVIPEFIRNRIPWCFSLKAEGRPTCCVMCTDILTKNTRIVSSFFHFSGHCFVPLCPPQCDDQN